MPAQAFIWNLGKLDRRARAFYVGPSIDTAVHRHHLTQICVGFEEPIRVFEREDAFVEHRAVLIPADHPHRVTTETMTPMAVIYLGSDACALKPTEGVTSLRPFDVDEVLLSDLRSAHDASIETPAARELCARVIETSGAGDVSERIVDARIRDIVELLRSDPTSKHSAESLAARANVSPRRLSDLFREEIGFPLRRYIVWMRLRLAIERVLSGGSLTEAAHSAGFADLAHLSHAFRDMYGVSPSYALDPPPRPRLVLEVDP